MSGVNRPAYHFQPCPAHPGRNIANHPCEVCGHPSVGVEAPTQRRSLLPLRPKGKEKIVARLKEPTSSIDIGIEPIEPPEHPDADRGGEVLPEPPAEYHPEEGTAREMGQAPPDYAVIDRNTGEMVQLSLLGAQWESYKVESQRVSATYGDEFIKTIFDELVDGELSPGAVVEGLFRGIVKEHAPIYKKDGHEGKTVIALQVLRRLTVIGHMTGKEQAAQNVDGEAKVLEEPGAGPLANEKRAVV